MLGSLQYRPMTRPVFGAQSNKPPEKPPMQSFLLTFNGEAKAMEKKIREFLKTRKLEEQFERFEVIVPNGLAKIVCSNQVAQEIQKWAEAQDS